MNRIYKVIWSKVKNCYVVVSEIAKRNSKSSTAMADKVVSSALAGLMLAGCLGYSVRAEAYAQIAGANGMYYQIPDGGVITATSQYVNNTQTNLVFSLDASQLDVPFGGYHTSGDDGSTMYLVTGQGASVAEGRGAKSTGTVTTAKGAGAFAWGYNTHAVGYQLDQNGYIQTTSGTPVTADGYEVYKDSAGNTYTIKVKVNPNDPNDQRTRTLFVYKDGSGQPIARSIDKKYYKVNIANGTASLTEIDAATYDWQGNIIDPRIKYYGTDQIYDMEADNTTAFGQNTIAAADEATAWGVNSKAIGAQSTAFGRETKATGAGATAWGLQSEAIGELATAFGQQSIAEGERSTAFGLSTTASGAQAIAIGQTTIAAGNNSFAGGLSSQTGANATAALAFGQLAKANGAYSIALGQNTQAEAIDSVAIGMTAKAEKESSFAIGREAQSTAAFSTAIGYQAKAQAGGAYALGTLAEATKDYSTAIGYKAKTTAANGVALGTNSVSSDKNITQRGYDLSNPSSQYGTPTNTTLTSSHVWKPAQDSGSIAVGNADNGITRRITGLAAGYELTDAVNVAQLVALKDQISSSSSDWQLADANGEVEGTTPYTVKTVEGKPQVTLKVVNNKVENPAANAQEYVIDLSELPD